MIIDLVGYRRNGHNEIDEPMFTQPAMYKKIKAHPTTYELFRAALVSSGRITEADAEEVHSRVRKCMEEEYDRSRESAGEEESAFSMSKKWRCVKVASRAELCSSCAICPLSANSTCSRACAKHQLNKIKIKNGNINRMVLFRELLAEGESSSISGILNRELEATPTGVPHETLAKIGSVLSSVPEGFTPHRTVQRILKGTIMLCIVYFHLLFSATLLLRFLLFLFILLLLLLLLLLLPFPCRPFL